MVQEPPRGVLQAVSSPGAKARFGRIGAIAVVAAALLAPGCYTTQLGLLRSGLDSLRVQVDTMKARDEIAYQVLSDTRHDLTAQRDLLLSTRANSGSTMQEMFDHMSRLEGKLDDVMHRFGEFASRSNTNSSGSPPPASGPVSPGTTTGPPPATSGAAPDPTQLYDQATRDLTEGRYPLALQGYRDFLARFPTTDLADNAQYGLAECFFAQAAFDSAAVAYAQVGARWPKGDRAAAALYKLGLCQERLGRAADARRTFQELINRFPAAGEAGLARERLGSTRH
jgi:tol-pal system protein YbgF